MIIEQEETMRKTATICYLFTAPICIFLDNIMPIFQNHDQLLDYIKMGLPSMNIVPKNPKLRFAIGG